MTNPEMKTLAILIPAYKPDAELMLPFVSKLVLSFKNIVVVDDGGGEDYASVFNSCRSLGITVLTHEVNRGKGAALKTGISYINEKCPEITGIITADCDGQHAVEDILKMAQAYTENPMCMIIGGRRFDNNVPARSKIGNSITRGMYKLATGISIYDTQTGLRAFGRHLFDELVALSGDRYEYEMNMLLKLREWGVKAIEITIKTIYINENQSSHYNAVKDSLKIGARIFLFIFSSIASFVVDYLLFLLLFGVFGIAEPISYGAARAVSSVVNYTLNRNVVFKGKCGKSAVFKYFGLVICVALLGMLVMKVGELYITPNMPGEKLKSIMPYVIKITYDVVMYVVNYFIQRDFVFKTKARK